MNANLSFSQMLSIAASITDMLQANSPLIKQPQTVMFDSVEIARFGTFVAKSWQFHNSDMGIVACLNPFVVLWQNCNIIYHPFPSELYIVDQDFVDAKDIEEKIEAASPELIAEVLRFIDPTMPLGPEKIQAIKHVREALSIGLKEAKRFVEVIQRGEYPKPQPSAKLCLSVSGDVAVEIKRV